MSCATWPRNKAPQVLERFNVLDVSLRRRAGERRKRLKLHSVADDSELSYSKWMMQNRINLSSRPFSNRRLFWLGIVLLVGVSVLSALWIDRERKHDLSRISYLEDQMASRKAEVERVKKEEEEKQKQDAKIFLSEQDTYELASARQLILRKSFGWDKMIGDLEVFVPRNARLLTIKVNGIVRDQNGVTASVELSALGKSPAELTEMMASFKKSEGLFDVGDAGQGEILDTGEVPFTIEVLYHPRSGGAQ